MLAFSMQNIDIDKAIEINLITINLSKELFGEKSAKVATCIGNEESMKKDRKNKRGN